MNGGITNSITRLHLVGYFFWVILRCMDSWILILEITDKNTIIKHQLLLCYYPWILNCDYFEFKHWRASKSTRNVTLHVLRNTRLYTFLQYIRKWIATDQSKYIGNGEIQIILDFLNTFWTPTISSASANKELLLNIKTHHDGILTLIQVGIHVKCLINKHFFLPRIYVSHLMQLTPVFSFVFTFIIV
jgi:hypothetical protein